MNDSNTAPATRGLEHDSNDVLPGPGAFSVSPFAEGALALSPPPAAQVQPLPSPNTLNHRQLARRCASPVGRLLQGSFWALKAWQLDLEFPPSIQSWLDQRLQDDLRARFGMEVDLDTPQIRFSTHQHPAVDSDGQEHFELQLSIRQLGRTVLDPAAFLALKRCAEGDRPLLAELPQLTLHWLFEWLNDARWPSEYQALLSSYWDRHAETWQMLAKLSFLDRLQLLHSRRRISRDAYRLGLDALGLKTFPRTLKALHAATRPTHSAVHGILLNDEVIPGIFHLKSHTTGHCYLHLLGDQAQCHEYISDDAPWNPGKVLQALNRSPWHRLHLDLGRGPASLALGEPAEDVIAQLCVAQRQFSIDRLDAIEAFDRQQHDVAAEDEVVLMPIQPALALVSAQNHWHGPAPLHERVPSPAGIANRLMSRWLEREHGVKIDAQMVFLRYVRGSSTTPWGHPRIPANNLIVAPDEQPIALGRALMSNYREQLPLGYDDHGGRWVVYADPDGQGSGWQERPLQISAASVAAQIASVDLLAIITARLTQFWDRQGPTIERSLWSTFIGQALLALKGGELSKPAFDLVVSAMQQAQQPDTPRTVRWSTLGFYLSNGLPGGLDCPACVGLLLIGREGESAGVLYQAGQRQAFVEYRDHPQLIEHLTGAAADEHWRRTLLHYMPGRLHSRLAHLLELWGGCRQPSAPVSILRPWLDQLYNEDAHKARQHALCEQVIDGCPVALILTGLRRNSLDDAQDSVVTDREHVIDHWTQQTQRLQILLAPLAMVLPAVSLALLTASAATLALNIQAANLPGNRQQERRQVMFAILSLGLLQLGPATPRLLRAFGRFRTAGAAAALGRVGVADGALPARGFSAWLRRATDARKTVFRPFFNGGGPLKSWSVAGNALFGTQPVVAWKLGRKFLLWTSDRT